MKNLKAGDPVRLIAIPTHRMAIINIDGDTAHCLWVHNGDKRTGDFPLATLELVPQQCYSGTVWTL